MLSVPLVATTSRVARGALHKSLSLEILCLTYTQTRNTIYIFYTRTLLGQPFQPFVLLSNTSFFAPYSCLLLDWLTTSVPESFSWRIFPSSQTHIRNFKLPSTTLAYHHNQLASLLVVTAINFCKLLAG